MRIESIAAHAVRIPLATPTAFSSRRISGREYVIVRVVDENGTNGIGYTYAGDSGGLWLRDGVEQLLAPRLRGTSVLEFDENWEEIFSDLLLIGRRGALVRMLSAVDIAVWDLIAKRADRPLRYLLGGSEDIVAAYASGGHYRSGDPCDNVTAELERYQELGFTDFKLKFGGLPFADDLERVAAARRVLEPDDRLALDINNAWQTFEQALEAIEALRDFDIWWIEQPFSPDHIANHAQLTAHSPIPIATGKIEATRWGFAQLVDQRAANILQPDACVAGGIGEWWRIAALARDEGLPVIPPWHANLHAQLAAATGNCTAVEYFALSEDIYNFERLVANPLTVANGKLLLDQTPGIGVEIDWEAVGRYAIATSTDGREETDTNGHRPSGADFAGRDLPPVAALADAGPAPETVNRREE